MEKHDFEKDSLFVVLYRDLEREVKEERRGQSIPTLDELIDNIKQEGFVDRIESGANIKFIYELYRTILNDYVKRGRGEFELNQMWKVFAKLSENGVQPVDQKSQHLYLTLAREVINFKYSDHIDTHNKIKFLTAGLDSFDSSLYFFRALNRVKGAAEVSAFFAYYADFIKAIAEVCPYEDLAYVILADQVKRKDAPGGSWNEKGIWIAECAEELRKKLYYYNHFAFSEFPEKMLFGKKIEQLVETHIGSIEEGTLDGEREELKKYPILIKKPSKRIYIPNHSPFYYHTTEID
jgi:hypothetical protein